MRITRLRSRLTLLTSLFPKSLITGAIVLGAHSTAVGMEAPPFKEPLSQANVTLSEMKNPHFEGLVIGNGDL